MKVALTADLVETHERSSRSDPDETPKSSGLEAWLAALALGLSAAVACLAHGRLAVRGSWAAESELLGTLLGLCVAGAALAGTFGRRVAMVVAPLGVLAVWGLPPGPTRSMVVGALGAIGFTLAVARHLPRGAGPDPRAWAAGLAAGLEGRPLGVAARDFARLLPWVLVAQVLFRNDLLLQPGVGAWWRPALLAPLLGAAALASLRPRLGWRGVALVAAVVFPIGPGLTSGSVLGLLGAAVGDRFLGPGRSLWVRAAAAVGFALLAVVETRAGIYGLLTAFLVSQGARFPFVGVVAAIGLSLVGTLDGGAPWRLWFFLVPFLLPAVVFGTSWGLSGLFGATRGLAGFRERRARPRAAAGFLCLDACALALVAERVVPESAALAGPLIVLVGLFVGVPLLEGRREPSRGPADSLDLQRFQGIWSGLIFAASAVLAAYPWLRPLPPWSVVEEAFGLGGRGGLLLLLLVLWLFVALLWWRPPGSRQAVFVFWAALLVVGLAATGESRSARSMQLLWGTPATVSAASPERSVELSGLPVRALVVDAALSNSVGLPVGDPVAILEIEGVGGETESLRLVAGRDVGEWAAVRPDLVAQGVVAPPAWLSTLDPSGTFFAQRYRTHLELDELVPARRLTVRRPPGLPDDLAITFYGLELVP